jgi:hypothetical protein
MRRGSCTVWTPERKRHALELWNSGKSAGAIAREIGGVTRNGIIGVITRAGATRSVGKAPSGPPDPCEKFSDSDLLRALKVLRDTGSVRALGVSATTAANILNRLDEDYRESLT